MRSIVLMLLLASPALAQTTPAPLPMATQIQILKACSSARAALDAAVMTGMPANVKSIAQPWKTYCDAALGAGTNPLPASTTATTPQQLATAKTNLKNAAEAAKIYLPEMR